MKIAFCFLTYSNIIRNDIWNIFFEGIDKDKYVVFIHPKERFITNDINYNIVDNIIDTNGKYNINIVKATLQLLKETFNYDNNISHYIFLSQSCIPLYNFDILYNIITKTDKSLISIKENNKKDRYTNLDNRIKPYISYKNFIKQQPNMILVKKDVENLINLDLTFYFKNMECPDEHYFINILLSIFKSKVHRYQTHFCNNDFSKTQALEFKYIDKAFIANIKKYKFLFMRKVTENSIIDFDYIASLRI